MGFSLFIHIILASLGIALPVIILSAEYIGIRKNDVSYSTLAKTAGDRFRCALRDRHRVRNACRG